MRTIVIAATAITAIATCFGAIAPTTELEEIVVTPSRRDMLLRETSDHIQVINRKQIEQLKPASTGELLEYATGVAVETGTGSGLPDRSIVSLNGLPANYTLVLVDGVRLVSDHIHSGQNLELVPVNAIERIEIMRTAGSAQYGADAIGGVVNIITRKGKAEPSGTINAAAGSYNTYEGGIGMQLPLGDAARLSTFLNWEQSDGVPLIAPAHRVNNMGYERLNLLTRLDANLSEATRVYAWLNYAKNTVDWRGDDADSYLLMPSVGLHHDVGENLTLATEISYSYWKADVNNEKNQIFEPKAYATWQISDLHTFMGGVDFRHNEFRRTAVEAPDQRTYGVFIQDDWRVSDLLSLTPSLRYDKTENINSALSPKLSALLSPSEKVRIRAAVARGFHAPTLQELYEEGYGHGGSAYRFGNPDLDPEYSTTYSLGIEVEPADPLQFMVHAFYSDIDDMIVPVYTGPWEEDPTKDVWKRTNIHEAEVYGAEANIRLALCDHARIEVGYTYTENEDKSTGRQLPYSPGSSVFTKLMMSYPIGSALNVSAFVSVRATMDREAWNWKPTADAAADNPDGLTTSLDDYTKLDAGITCTIHDTYEVFLRVRNILGEDIENLDDAYTVIDGEPTVQVGMRYNLPLML
ncbi:MAG: TonB-dependent receptor [Verrucomicrobia bacterium]|jgi:outer membrane receptor for ferrienterochelin and colicins|nr:TonB-dependent receptor [Verrucomicrobiota bacterium]